MESYKSRVALIEVEEVQTIENEKEIILAKLSELKDLRMDSETNLQKKYFEDTKDLSHEKLAALLKAWQTDESGSANEYWAKFKNKLTLGGV